MQELINSLGLQYGTIVIRVKSGRWVHAKIEIDFNKNECENLENFEIGDKNVDKYI